MPFWGGGGPFAQPVSGVIRPRTSTSTLEMGDGSVTAPSFGFINSPGAGLYWGGIASRFDIAAQSGHVCTVTNPAFVMRATGAYAWSAAAGPSVTMDLTLERAAAGVLAVRAAFGGAGGRVRVGDGAAGTPAYSFLSAEIGFFIPAAGNLGIGIGGSGEYRINADAIQMGGNELRFGTNSATNDVFLLRGGAAATLQQGQNAANDAPGVAQVFRAPSGGTATIGVGQAGGILTLAAGIGSAAFATSGAAGGAGGDLQLRPGTGGAGDGGGAAGAGGRVDFLNSADGAGAAVGTLANAPTAGDPAFWLTVKVNGAVRYIPCWA